MKKLLTIGIPTYNRAQSLTLMLSQLVKDIGVFAPVVEIVVSDNCSTDDTPSVIEAWKKDIPTDLSVRSVRNVENIGVSKNLVSLFYMAETPYFTFLGDDDRINGAMLSRLIEILQKNNPPSVVICAQWGGKTRGLVTGYINYNQAAHLFYEYGNAWASVVDTKAAVNAIESRGLREEIEKIVWPQTVMGYLAMHDLSERKIYAADFEMGGPLGSCLSIPNKAYWVRSLYGLLKAASLIEKATGGKVVRRTFLKRKGPGFYSHIKAILWYSLIADASSSTEEIRRLLYSDYGVRGYVWSCLLKVGDNPRLLKQGAQCCFMLKNGKGRDAFEDKLEEARRGYQTEVAQIAHSKKRFGDWF